MVNPPFEEEVCARNSYANNLSSELERRKLRELTEMIGQSFDAKPILYKAGRYGADAETLRTIETLGYQIDSSVLPWTDLSAHEGQIFLPARAICSGSTIAPE